MSIDEATVESPLDQNLQFAEAEHGDGALPAGPDEAVPLRPQLIEGVAQKACNEIPIELAAQGDHGESLTHTGADELIDTGIENDVEERLRVAVKDRRHDPVGGFDDRVS